MTPTLFDALAAMLLKYHAGRVHERYWGESPSERRGRISLIARANIAACRRVKLPGRWSPGGCLALLVTVEEWESGLERGVHEGTKRGPAGEACLVQLHPSVYRQGAIRDPDYRVTKEEWESLPGLGEEATEACAFAGAKVLMYHVERCSVPFSADSWWAAARVFAEYHHPSGECRAHVLPMSSRRGMTYASIYRKLLPDLED
jgi:hypothetical protein